MIRNQHLLDVYSIPCGDRHRVIAKLIRVTSERFALS